MLVTGLTFGVGHLRLLSIAWLLKTQKPRGL